jgi:4-hydroxythreonine-4-phosphate dehydrogenase
VKPRVAVVMGDPSGVGPEVLVRALAGPAALDGLEALVVGDRRVLRRAETLAARRLPAAVDVMDLAHCPPEDVPLGVASPRAGRAAGEALERAFGLAREGTVHAVCYAPLHKRSLHDAGYPFEDELHLFAHWTGSEGVGEINALERLWTSRVTSHIGLARVAASLSLDGVVAAVGLLHQAQRRAGWERPRIAVAALNPHGGEGGLFGDEEQRVIGPAVEAARRAGVDARGPIPADTVFVRASRGEFDAVVTMYHDQGQIAMKLLGFERGVTIGGGLPFPVTTPAHGTAHDIAARGVARPGAMEAALGLAARMARP